MVEVLVYLIWIAFVGAVAFFAMYMWAKKQRRLMQEEVEKVRRAYAKQYPQAIRMRSPLDPHARRHRSRMDEYLPNGHGLGGADATRCNQEREDKNANQA